MPWFFSSKSLLRVSVDSALSIEKDEYPCASARIPYPYTLTECDPTATRDLIITSIISTCRFTSAGSDSLTTPHVLSSLSLTTPLFAADSVDTLNRRSASFTSSTVASGDSRIFASASAMRMMASS